MSFTLKTVALNDQAIGCIECNGDSYALTDLVRHNHCPDLPTTVIGLFADWAGNVARLNAACDNLAGLTPLPGNLPLLAPLQYPGKLLCAGANYYDHNLEMGVTETRKEATRLFFFFKAPLNSVVGPGDTGLIPALSTFRAATLGAPPTPFIKSTGWQPRRMMTRAQWGRVCCPPNLPAMPKI